MSVRTLRAARSIAEFERRSGIFLSSASPVQDMNTLGIISVAPLGVCMIKAGLVGSQAVYPRAALVMRRLPLGKDEPSGSPLMSRLPVNSVIALPSEFVMMNPSCFSAVMLVSG